MLHRKLALCGIVACFDVLNVPDKCQSHQIFLWPTCSSVRVLGWPNPLGAGGNPWGRTACPVPSPNLPSYQPKQIFVKIIPWDCSFCHKEHWDLTVSACQGFFKNLQLFYLSSLGFFYLGCLQCHLRGAPPLRAACPHQPS